MNYRQKRNRSKLSVYTVSSRLGIDYNVYLDIENGKKELEGARIDKFLEIINNAKTIKFQRAQKMIKVDEWFKSGEVKNAIKKWGYNQYTLSKKLKISQSYLCNVINNSKNDCQDIKERIYDFLTDTLNKNTEEQEISKAITEVDSIENSVENVNQVEDDVQIQTLSISESDENLKQEIHKLQEEVIFYKDILKTMCYLNNK